jgi:hypothetical protein
MLAYESVFVTCRKARPRAVTASAGQVKALHRHVNCSSASYNCGSDCLDVSDLVEVRMRKNVSRLNYHDAMLVRANSTTATLYAAVVRTECTTGLLHESSDCYCTPSVCSSQDLSRDNAVGVAYDTNSTPCYRCLHHEINQAIGVLLQSEQSRVKSHLCCCLLHLESVSWQLMIDEAMASVLTC